MNEDLNKVIGKWLSEKRKEANITQIAVAERMNCTRQRICNWEKGIRNMSAADFFQYCEIIHADPDDLVDYMRRKRHASV